MGFKLDESGVGGIYLPKKNELGDISARAIGQTMTRVGREILPLGEKLKYVLSGGRKTPDFRKAFDHVFVHPGGPAVIEKFGKALGYDASIESANAINAYYYYGNTSSAGVLYAMSYTESVPGIRKGDRLLALGLGAGFESNGTVMTAMRDCVDVHQAWRHLVEDPSLQPLAVEAFVRGFRQRERVCSLDSSEERKILDLVAFARRNGYENPYGPEPSMSMVEGALSMSVGVTEASLHEESTDDADSSIESESISSGLPGTVPLDAASDGVITRQPSLAIAEVILSARCESISS